MTDPLHDTQPTRPPNLNEAIVDVRPEPYEPYDDGGGPGCLIWGGLGFFMVLMSAAIVLIAGMAGWSDGLKIAYSEATAEEAALIDQQCQLIVTDLNEGRFSLAQQRLISLEAMVPVVPCVATLAPQATARFLESQPMQTALPEATATIESLVTATPEPEATSSDVVDAVPTSNSPYDLDGLLTEAEQLLAEGDVMEAIDTLEAIQALDATYQKARIDQMLFNALINEAERNFRAPGGSLAEAILLTDRAAEYGDIGEMAFEREVASLYLSAQTYLNLNFGEAIRLLNSVLNLSSNYKNARSLLYGQYVAYGDALMASFSSCQAVVQYNNALQMQNDPSVGGKRDAAQTACELGQTATPGPGEGGGSTTPIAPIGVPGT